MDKKPKKRWKKWLNYKFDSYISRGVRAQFVLLAIAIVLIVVFFGMITGIVSNHFSIGDALWQSLIHILDQGTVGGDEPTDIPVIIPMMLVTLLGMAFTGTIVGIINNAMSVKLDDLKKGHSQIMEEHHTVVIGFDENIHTILKEIEQSNENFRGNRTVVVVDETDKEEMEFIVKEHNRTLSQSERKEYLKSGKVMKTKRVFRSGSTISDNTFTIASVEKARAIIINKEDDFDVIRIILALNAYLKKNKPNEELTIVTLMHEKENIDAAAVAAGIEHEGKISMDALEKVNSNVRILYFEDILAHIFAQVCKQPGLSWILAELFDYDNSEFYIESVSDKKNLPDITGKTFEQISHALQKSIAVGIYRKDEDKIILDPAPSEIFEPGDKLIHLAKDDNEIELNFQYQAPLIGTPAIPVKEEKRICHFLIFGWSIPLPVIVENIDCYAEPGSSVTVITRHVDDESTFSCPYQAKKKRNKKPKEIKSTRNIEFETVSRDPYDWEQVEDYLDQMDWENKNSRPTNIVIMCQDGVDKVEADEKAAVLLLNIRQYLKLKKADEIVNITTEMNLPEDQHLLALTNVNDFIVGSEIANRMMVQVSNDTNIYRVFKELLTDRDSELYLRDFSSYVDVNKDFNFHYIQQVAQDKALLGENKQEVVLGWIKLGYHGEQPEIKLNPTMEEREMKFTEVIQGNSLTRYKLVVIAYDFN